MEQNNELAVMQKANFMPVMDSNDVLARHSALAQFRSQVLKQDVDYGKIPGTSKDTLLKPGAEKLCTLFGLSASFEIVDRVEDWNGKQHDGEAFFYYLYRCTLSRGETNIASSDGSCNSFEKKYRYRTANRKCPTCGAEAIIKGKAEYGGGWLCWKKKDGCGATFKDGDEAIESQEAGNVPNPDVADLVNTIQKMAQKRALVAAALLAVNASEFFTQDMEDFVVQEEHAPQQPVQQTIELATPAMVKHFNEVLDAAIAMGFTTKSGVAPKPFTVDMPKHVVEAKGQALLDFITAKESESAPLSTEEEFNNIGGDPDDVPINAELVA